MEDKIRITLTIKEATDLIKLLTHVVFIENNADYSEAHITLYKLNKAKLRYLNK